MQSRLRWHLFLERCKSGLVGCGRTRFSTAGLQVGRQADIGDSLSRHCGKNLERLLD
jgi:hypothetical protein